MINIQELIDIDGKEYQENVSYFIGNNDLEKLIWIGYVDISDGNNVVFHHNLTTRSYEEFMNLEEKEILSYVVNETFDIIGDPVNKNIIDKIRAYEHAVNNGYLESYSFMKPIVNDIETYRSNLLLGMDNKCQETIQKGFYSEAIGAPHFYRFNKEEDQLNFNQQLTILIVNPEITTVYWKTEDVGVLTHTKEQFLKVISDAALWKQNNISKYWTIKNMILKATTLEELKNINWDIIEVK